MFCELARQAPLAGFAIASDGHAAALCCFAGRLSIPLPAAALLQHNEYRGSSDWIPCLRWMLIGDMELRLQHAAAPPRRS